MSSGNDELSTSVTEGTYLSLSGSDGRTKIGLWRCTEYTRAFAALRCVARDDMISRFHTLDSGSHRFYDASSFVAKDAGKKAFWILSIQSVNISMTKGIGDHFHTDFSSFGRINRNSLL